MLVRCVCMRHTYINVSYYEKNIDLQNENSRLHGVQQFLNIIKTFHYSHT